jgi:hypothetical protein
MNILRVWIQARTTHLYRQRHLDVIAMEDRKQSEYFEAEAVAEINSEWYDFKIT